MEECVHMTQIASSKVNRGITPERKKW